MPALAISMAAVPHAYGDIAASAISKFSFPIYGMYTSSDPTCQSGLIATVPITATPTVVNFATGTPLGSGPIANPINCVVFVLQNTFTVNWSAGTYSTTSTELSNTFNDSHCNGGTSGVFLNPLPIDAGSTPSWPSQIITDLQALGLTPQTVAIPSSPTQKEIIPLYLSSDSVCEGDLSSTTTDPASCYNGQDGWNPLAPPTKSGDYNGIRMASPNTSSQYKFVTNLNKFIGGNGSNS